MAETGMMADIAAVTDNNRGYYPVPYPMFGGYGGGYGNGFGGDFIWVILLLALFGGWGGGFGGGFGGFGNLTTDSGLLGYAIGNNATKGDLSSVQLSNKLDNLSTQICGGFADTSTQLCNGFNNINTGLLSGFANTNLNACQNTNNIVSAIDNARFAQQQCCCENKAAIADLKYTVATENCADRAALSNGVRDIIANQTASTQAILDKLCDQELQAERRENQNLRQELLYARGQASQIEQTAQLRAGQAAEVDALYNRLSNCPVPTTPVYGRTPIFTCNNGCGCNGNSQFLV